MSLNILSIGGSRNIGYFASLRFLNAGCTVTFLLRSPNVFDEDTEIQRHVASGKARLLKGDALVKEDVQRAWDEAGTVDVLLFTVGGKPSFSARNGFVITPPNLVTQALFNVLRTMPKQEPQPRIVTISSAGLTHSGHAALPLPLKPLYGYLLAEPHKDKLGSECLIYHCAGWRWDPKEAEEPGKAYMGSDDWKNDPELPAPGSLKKVLVIRPALLIDSKCRADKPGRKKPAYRVSDAKDFGGWEVSRRDVAHFIEDAVFNRWNEFENKCVAIAY
ncbi:hypothetical protein CPC08DRAFT_65758 [Agrocybe pediades]|nr:hypothetical protein CPC08DRAFT_65758 [Agrocybe pediades]